MKPFRSWSRDLFIPANGATLSGTAVLDATATGYFTVTKVEFYLTGGITTRHADRYGPGQAPIGWITRWNTTTVANGTYTLQSVAYDAGGTQRDECQCFHHRLKLTTMPAACRT